MSVRALNWAYSAKIENTTYKFVLCVLANYANDDDEAWPYIETLAETVSCGRRTVERALAALEEDGWITRHTGFMVGHQGGGLRKTNSVFQLHIPGESAARRTGRPSVLRSESPSEVQYVTGDALVAGDGETPSEVQYDTGDVSVHQCDTGDATNATRASMPILSSISRSKVRSSPPQRITHSGRWMGKNLLGLTSWSPARESSQLMVASSLLRDCSRVLPAWTGPTTSKSTISTPTT